MERQYRFLLLDFGHPMNIKTIENVINSLKNVLALGAAFPRTMTGDSFGISILNSDFAVFRTDLCKSYGLIFTKMDAVLKTMNTSSRITVQEYKYVLGKSIQAVLHEFQKFRECDDRCLIEITVITKKTATVLADIIRDVMNKLQNVIPSFHSNQKYKIVQILDQEQKKTCQIPSKSSSIDCIPCIDTLHALNSFFKDSLLNPQQRLRIFISEDPDFGVECDTEDCIINPVALPFERRHNSFNELRSAGLIGISKPSYSLKVINRFPVNGLCPTLVFGIPRRVYATQSDALSWTESQNNSKIFKELCRQLHQTGEGLLAKAVLPAERNSVSTFHLLASDGETLLLNDVSPEELYLPNRYKPSLTADFDEDMASASLITSCLKKIEYFDEYLPRNFSSGIYDHLRSYLAGVGQSKSSESDPSLQTFTDKKEKELSKKHQFDGSDARNAKKKKLNSTSGVSLENIHPALLTPKTVEKYRKIGTVQKKKSRTD